MSEFCSQNFDKGHNSDINDDYDFEKDDLVTFQHNSKNINFYYSQLTKYSKHIREKYLFSDAINRLPLELDQLQEETQLLPENVALFFQLLERNYELNEGMTLKYNQCVDLLQICNFFEVRKLSSKIKRYIKSHDIEVDFILQMLEYDLQKGKVINDNRLEISEEIENVLSSKINECFSNEKFKELPIQIIYRVINKSSPTEINSNKLFDIIMTSLSKFCVLLQFLDLQKLSEDRLEELCKMHSKSDGSTQHCFDYLKCNLSLLNEINSRKKNLEEMNDEQRNLIKDLETKVSSLESQLSQSKELNKEQQSKVSDLEASLRKHFDESEKVNAQIQDKLNASEKVNTQLQSQLDDSKKQISEQQSKMKDLLPVLKMNFSSMQKSI